MTSAWLASALGVGGTIIGAALGSLVVAISSSFYASTLDRGRTLIVQTDSGTRIERDSGDEPADDAPGGLAEAGRRIRWKVVALTTVVILALSGAAMGAYEIVTDKPYGSDSGNAKLGNPFGGGNHSSGSGGTEPQDTSDPEDQQAPQDEEEPTEPTPSATETTRPTASVPTPSATSVTPRPTSSAGQGGGTR